MDTTDGSATASTDSTGTTGENTGQPEDDMYSDCFEGPGNCEGGDLMCLEIDPGGRTMDAICTSNECSNPEEDCDPAPGGTAEPQCLMTPPPNEQSVCVLSCADGAECPMGMSCYAIGLGIEICG